MISVVVPIYNEKDSIPFLVEELNSVFSLIGKKYEILLIDDGSIDESWKAIQEASRNSGNVKGVKLRRNYGQTAALYAGIARSKGEVIITIDADLENDPKDIPKLLSALENGCDIVSGWRKERWGNESFTRKTPSLFANLLISRIGKVKLNDFGCTLKAYKRQYIKDLPLYGDMHRFIPVYASMRGAKVCEVPVSWRERRFGESKYGLSRIFKVILDLLYMKFAVKYMVKPIQFFGGIGLISFLLGLLTSTAAIILKIAELRTFVSTPLPVLSAMFISVGVQFSLFGVLAEMVMRTYFESQNKLPFEVSELTGAEE